MYQDIFRKFLDTSYNKCNIYSDPPTGIVAAVSGGSDSVCLLMLLCEYIGKENIICAHFNHRLREGEADRDEDFTRNLAMSVGVRFVCGSADVRSYSLKNGLGTEEGARKLRYEFLHNIAHEAGDALIATGHNSGDRIETVIFNIARGTSVDGLKGIEYRTKKGIVRPILDLTKAETLEVCEYFGIKPMYDSTNSDNSYRRNLIRNNLLPYIKNNLGSDIEEHILRLSDSAAADSEYLNERTEEAYAICCTEQDRPFRRILLDTYKFSKLHVSIKKRLIRYIMGRVKDELGREIFPNCTGVYSDMIETACLLAENMKTGKRVDMPLGLKCVTEAGYISFIHITCLESGQKRIYESMDITAEALEIPQEEIQCIIKNKKENEEIFDADKLSEIAGADIFHDITRIEFRSGKSGDRFTPFGAAGGKGLNKFYIDKKISKAERMYIKIAALGNEVLWIPGIRRSGAAPIDKNTTRVIILRCISNTEDNT